MAMTFLFPLDHCRIISYTEPMKNEYVQRINCVMDYIDSHLDGDLSLRILAKVAHFSPFHFHRIFRGMVGETLNQFIQRIRLEKAAARLASNFQKTVTEIALDCGFSSSAAFARSFKDYFGLSATAFRNQCRCQGRKICETNSKIGESFGKIRKDFQISAFYIDGITQRQTWRVKMKEKQLITVEVKKLPEHHVAYVRHIGPYKGDSGLFEGLFSKLMKWAGPRGLIRFPETQCMSVYHDDPNITDDMKLRTSVCLTVPKGTPVDGEIGSMTIPGGTFAVAHCEVSSEEFEGAWNMLCGEWLPNSGYEPSDGMCYELYLNDHRNHPEKKHIVDICIPVKPL